VITCELEKLEDVDGQIDGLVGHFFGLFTLVSDGLLRGDCPTYCSSILPAGSLSTIW
jgi:hypothetical protein